jgi:site-specific DNA recombinase
VRTDRLDLAVWQEVCALLAHPERVSEEYRRRREPGRKDQQQERSALETQVSKFRQGLSRLIDSYAEGLIDKAEFAPRMHRLRQRIAHVNTQCEKMADEETLQQDLHLIIGRLEVFGQNIHDRLDDIEWGEQREIIRALVKRVEIGEDHVQVVFRVEPYLGETDPEKKSLQLCRGSRLSLAGPQLSEGFRGSIQTLLTCSTRLLTFVSSPQRVSLPGWWLAVALGRTCTFWITSTDFVEEAILESQQLRA